MSAEAARVLTRFAPSPTGHLHVGGLRTALFNALFAAKHDGAFLLRMEDTDSERSRPEFEASIMDDLAWAGVNWQGPVVRQSERAAAYREGAEKLLAKGLAYRCRCTRERLEELKKSQLAAKTPPRYDGRCRDANVGADEAKCAIRFRVPGLKVAFKDAVHGAMTFDTRAGHDAFGDFVIIGSDGMATYNFAAAIDDAEQGVTHVIRGDDHLSNTPRQILVTEALGAKPPAFAHVPLVLGLDKAPLSKRTPGASVADLRAHGYLPIAVVNCASRIGWSPKDNSGALLGLDEMASLFDLTRLSKSAGIFDPARLAAFGKQAMAEAPSGDLARLAGFAADKVDMGIALKAIEAAKKSSHTIEELKALVAGVVSAPEPEAEAAAALKTPEAKNVLLAAIAAIDSGADDYEKLVNAIKAATGLKGRPVFMALRAALTGAISGMELKVVFDILGARECASRLRRAD